MSDLDTKDDDIRYQNDADGLLGIDRTELAFQVTENDEIEGISVEHDDGNGNDDDGGIEDGDTSDDNDGDSDTDDDYDISETDEFEDLENVSHDARFVANLTEHSKYLTNVLAQALELVDLDKSLVLQAQLSGRLNNENQKIIDKTNLIRQKLVQLQLSYQENFQPKSGGISKIAQLKLDIANLESRLNVLKHGSKPSLFKLKKKSQVENIAEKYPIEYNQAKDKVIERQYEGQIP